jgi:hypothetical protein
MSPSRPSRSWIYQRKSASSYAASFQRSLGSKAKPHRVRDSRSWVKPRMTRGEAIRRLGGSWQLPVESSGVGPGDYVGVHARRGVEPEGRELGGVDALYTDHPGAGSLRLVS